MDGQCSNGRAIHSNRSRLVPDVRQLRRMGRIACAVSRGRTHPVVGIWPVALADALERALVDEGIRKIDCWTARYRLVEVEFPADNVDPFFNAMVLEDLAEAERLLPLER